jgi:prevent-host-death family protein
MQTLPQMASVTDLRNDYNALIGRLHEGPIVLSQRSKPAAVLVSPEYWNETARLIQELQEQLGRERRLRRSTERHAALVTNPEFAITQQEFDHQLQEAGLL